MCIRDRFGNENFYIIDNSGGLEDPERKENFVTVEKAIRRFVTEPPRKPQAKSWLINQKKQ